MPHLLEHKTRAELTPKGWLKLGTQIAQYVNDRALRSDVVAFIGEGAGQDHAACFIPSLAEIELNREIAFVENVEPAWVGDFTERTTQFDWPKATGATLHEASHARWTHWSLEILARYKRSRADAPWANILEMMEEPRIETLAVKTWPQDAPFLRASAMEIIIKDLDLDKLKAGNLYSLSSMMLLTLARRDGGILTKDDTETINQICTDVFGPDLMREFQSLWLQAIHLDDPDPTVVFGTLERLAREWVDLIPKPEDEEDGEQGDDQEGEGPPGDGTGIPQEIKDMLEDIEQILEEAQANAETGAQDDAADQQEQERWQETTSERNERDQEVKENKKESDKVFGKDTNDDRNPNTSSRIAQRRAPKPAEHSAAVILAQELERAKYRDRVRTETQSVIPPGKLRTRDAIQAQAQRERGQMVTAEPWVSTHRRHVEDPTLKIGVAVDISGSMRRAMEPMAVTAWILAEAGYRIQAQVAQVYYGNCAFPTLKPGQRMPEVIVRTAADGVERFNSAFKALDGKLELLQGSGARLLVICSDTCYTAGESDALEKWVGKCIRAGVGVVIMTYDGRGGDAMWHGLPREVQIITDPLPPVEAARTIGQAAVKALAAVSQP